MKIKKIRKIIKRIILILLILLICLIAYMQTPLMKAKLKLSYINSSTKLNENIITVGNTHVWYSVYDGEINSIVLDKSAYNFATILVPEYYKIDDLNFYYDKNSKYIKMYTGISEKQEFVELVNKIKKLNGGNELILEKYEIYENSVTKVDGLIQAIIGIQYKNNDKMLLTVKFKNKVEPGKASIIYSPNVDNSKQEYDTTRDKLIDNTNIDTSKKPGKVTK